MSAHKQEESHSHPRPGAFVVMMVGLFLFFGMVSRIGKINTPQALLSGTIGAETPAENSQRQTLQSERERVIAVIGGENSTPEVSAPVRETSTPPAPTRQPEAAPAQPQRTPRRATPPQRPVERAYVVRENDTLYSIARVVYGDGNKWTAIVKANPGLSPDSMRVGQRLVLPYEDTAPGSYSMR